MIFQLLVALVTFAEQEKSYKTEYHISHAISVRDKDLIEYGLSMEKDVLRNSSIRPGFIVEFRPLINIAIERRNWSLEKHSIYSIPWLLYLNTMSYSRIEEIETSMNSSRRDSSESYSKLDKGAFIILGLVSLINGVRNLELGYRFNNGISLTIVNIMHEYDNGEIKGVGFSLGMSSTKISIDYLYKTREDKNNEISFTIETGLRIISD